jgi:hypothetical protein
MNQAYSEIRIPLVFSTTVLWIITLMINYLKWRSQRPSYNAFCFCYNTYTPFLALLFGCPLFWASILLSVLIVVLEISALVGAISQLKIFEIQ